MGCRIEKGLLLAGLALAKPITTGVFAQSLPIVTAAASTPETTLDDVFGRLAGRAGFIFAGTVQSIERKNGVVEVGLAVEQVLQGNPGTHYILREWAGLWPPGQQRYRPGQRALFFLRAPGTAGLSSPVDGLDGVVPLAGDPSGVSARLDVRRLSTRLLREAGQPLSGTTSVTLTVADEMIAAAQAGGHRRPVNPSGERPVPIVVRVGGAERLVEGSRGQP